MLADYSYYTREYRGTQIEAEAEFSALQIRAEAYINKITFGRADDSNGVKNAVCAVCEVYAAEAKDRVSSETVGRHTVAYRENPKSLEKRAYQAASLFLANTGLMYRGLE